MKKSLNPSELLKTRWRKCIHGIYVDEKERVYIVVTPFGFEAAYQIVNNKLKWFGTVGRNGARLRIKSTWTKLPRQKAIVVLNAVV